MTHTQLLLARSVRVVEALTRKGCTVLRVTIDGSMPLIEIDRAPLDGPAMVLAIRNSGGPSRTVYVTDWQGCRVECPARRPAASRPAAPVYPRVA